MVLYTGALLQATLLTIASRILNDNSENEALFSKQTFQRGIPYDYIVVGGGVAGCVVAARLAEKSDVTVLLLEEGYPEGISNEIPAMDFTNIWYSHQLNRFSIVPQNDSLQGFPDKKFTFLTAKALGGGSVISGMMYSRGGPLDFDGWVRDYNATTWSSEDVKPFFLKMEDQKDQAYKKDTKYHATGGPMTIVTPDLEQASPTYKLLATTMTAAANEIGFENIDFNAEKQIGVNPGQRFMRNGKRLSVATAYLRPLAGQPNLQVLTGAKVNQIIFDGTRASGVTFTHKGQSEIVKVRRSGGEIILSAGAINSPKLLLLSGVGPKKDLQQLEIPLVADLPVGKNLHDHARVVGADFFCAKPLFTFWQDYLTVENLEQFYGNGSGVLANSFHVNQGSTINVRTSVPDGGALFGPSDTSISPALGPPGYVYLAAPSPDLKKELLDSYYGPYITKHNLNLAVTLNYVKSRGHVKLQSKNPDDPPIINPRYLSNPDDLARVMEAYKIAKGLILTAALKALDCKNYEIPLSDCAHLFHANKSTTDDYLKCKVRHLSAGENHPAGTCKMAGVDDPTAVVDTTLKVRDLKGLRVADASIMPSIVTGGPIASVIMIGERAAHLILSERQKRHNSK